MKERLASLLRGRSIRSAADDWGLPFSTVRNWLSRGSIPPLDTAAKVAKIEGISLDWLAEISDEPNSALSSKIEPGQPVTASQPIRTELDDGFVMVHDFSNVEAAAGGGAYVTDEEAVERMAFRREWIAREGLQAQALRIIRARGDSMEPTIQDGAPILVEAFSYADAQGNVRHLRAGSTPEEVVTRDGVYVIRLNERLLVKRLQLDMLGGLLVKSDNQTYDTLHITASQIEEIAVIGRVVWTGRKL